MSVVDFQRFRELLRPRGGRHAADPARRDAAIAAAARQAADDDGFVEMYWRMTRALERRVVDDPAALLPHAVALAARVAEIPNVAIAVAAADYAVDPHSAPSLGECARALGVTKQAGTKRRAIGERIIAGRVAAGDVERYAEAARERAARQAADAVAVTAMADYRARRAAS